MEREEEGKDLITVLSRFWARLGGGIVLLCAFAISFDVLTRSLFGATYLESFELGRYAFAISVAFGFAYALTTEAHIRIDAIYRLMPKPAQIVLDLLALVSIALLAALMTYYGYSLVHESLELGVRSATSLRVYMWIPQALWLIGLIWFTVSAWWLVFRFVLRLLARVHEAASARRLLDRGSRS